MGFWKNFVPIDGYPFGSVGLKKMASAVPTTAGNMIIPANALMCPRNLLKVATANLSSYKTTR